MILVRIPFSSATQLFTQVFQDIMNQENVGPRLGCSKVFKYQAGRDSDDGSHEGESQLYSSRLMELTVYYA